MAGKIFINYRRDDSIGTAGRLHDRLTHVFGRKNVFMDVDHIPAGVDFVRHLNTQVAECDAFLVIIGPDWLDTKDSSGRRRLDNPDDFVRVEILAALARDVRVIPVLVDDAHMPKPEELPEPLRSLSRRHAVEVRNVQFGSDAERLIGKVAEALKGRTAIPMRGPVAVAGAAALLLAGWVGLYQLGAPVWVPWKSAADTAKAQQEAKRAADAAAAKTKEVAEAAKRVADATRPKAQVQGSPSGPPAQDYRIRVINRRQVRIERFYFSSCKAENFGQDRLGSNEYINVGDNKIFDMGDGFRDCCRDLQATFADGVKRQRMAVDVCRESTWEVK